ncbi:MAG: hypothetical protein ABR538_06590 [Candidatus Binatia bacterium]
MSRMSRKGKPRFARTLLVASLLAASATVAAAHCCHDERSLGAWQQSELPRGPHGLDQDSGQKRLGSGAGAMRTDPARRTGSLNDGGLGQMRGNSVGNYGAGSLGERGPGGLGALQGNTVPLQPNRPR